ncbi:MAG: hypothetical protein ABIU05_22110 [Nitrospirales bacterium]
MFSNPKFAGIILLCVGVVFLWSLSGCQSLTGKMAGQTMSDASITTSVQTKLSSDRLSNLSRTAPVNAKGDGGVGQKNRRGESTNLRAGQ